MLGGALSAQYGAPARLPARGSECGRSDCCKTTRALGTMSLKRWNRLAWLDRVVRDLAGVVETAGQCQQHQDDDAVQADTGQGAVAQVAGVGRCMWRAAALGRWPSVSTGHGPE
jgi:hypothetical protein